MGQGEANRKSICAGPATGTWGSVRWRMKTESEHSHRAARTLAAYPPAPSLTRIAPAYSLSGTFACPGRRPGRTRTAPEPPAVSAEAMGMHGDRDPGLGSSRPRAGA